MFKHSTHTVRRLVLGGLSVGLVGTIGSAIAPPAFAVQFPDGTVAFDRPPELVEAVTRTITPGLEGDYHFTIAVPSNAGEPLEAVVISPRNHIGDISFMLDESQASLGNAFASGANLNLANVGGAPDNPDDVLVVFDEPVMPGNTVTITLTGRNPSYGGTYQFGVTAYPAGDNTIGNFIGYGRFGFFDNN